MTGTILGDGLSFVDPSTSSLWRNILLYGPPGIGKSTGAASAPGPILYLNAEGENGVQFARKLYGHEHIQEVAVTSKRVLDTAYLEMRSNPGRWPTCVVDTAGEVFGVMLREIARGGKPTLPNYGDATTVLERFVMSLRDLPLNVVLIAHELVLEDTNDEGGFERVPFVSTKTGSQALASKFVAQFDDVGYVARVESSEEGGEAHYMAQLVSARGRIGKNRGGALGKYRDLNISEWITTMRAEPVSEAPEFERPTTPMDEHIPLKTKKEAVRA